MGKSAIENIFESLYGDEILFQGYCHVQSSSLLDILP